jgi:hypothetical protein
MQVGCIGKSCMTEPGGHSQSPCRVSINAVSGEAKGANEPCDFFVKPARKNIDERRQTHRRANT